MTLVREHFVTGGYAVSKNKGQFPGCLQRKPYDQAVFAFRRHEDASLSYTGIESQAALRRIGGYDTVVAIEA